MNQVTFEEHEADKAKAAKRRRMAKRLRAYQRDHRRGQKADRHNFHEKARDRNRLDKDALRCDLNEWLGPIYDWEDTTDEASADIMRCNHEEGLFYRLVDYLDYLIVVFDECPSVVWHDNFILHAADLIDSLNARDPRARERLTFEQEKMYEKVKALWRAILDEPTEEDLLYRAAGWN